MPSPIREETHLLAILASIAHRAIPADADDVGSVVLDRTALYRFLRDTYGVRQRDLYAAISTDDDLAHAFMRPRGRNRWAVCLVRVTDDPWTDELGPDPVAIASSLGFDVSSPLPEDLVLRLVPAATDEDEDEEPNGEKDARTREARKPGTYTSAAMMRAEERDARRDAIDAARKAAAEAGLIPAEKRCPRCEEVKPAAAYGSRYDGARRGTLQSWCRACTSDRLRSVREERRVSEPSAPHSAPISSTSSPEDLDALDGRLRAEEDAKRAKRAKEREERERREAEARAAHAAKVATLSPEWAEISKAITAAEKSVDPFLRAAESAKRVTPAAHWEALLAAHAEVEGLVLAIRDARHELQRATAHTEPYRHDRAPIPAPLEVAA